jgi:hypothetical protein
MLSTFYNNQACEMFSRPEGGVDYVYLGPLADSA